MEAHKKAMEIAERLESLEVSNFKGSRGRLEK
jgi:hypothetical protein